MGYNARKMPSFYRTEVIPFEINTRDTKLDNRLNPLIESKSFFLDDCLSLSQLLASWRNIPCTTTAFHLQILLIEVWLPHNDSLGGPISFRVILSAAHVSGQTMNGFRQDYIPALQPYILLIVAEVDANGMICTQF